MLFVVPGFAHCLVVVCFLKEKIAHQQSGAPASPLLSSDSVVRALVVSRGSESARARLEGDKMIGAICCGHACRSSDSEVSCGRR
jgi:hypothetical protein